MPSNPATYGRTHGPKAARCDLIRQFQDTILGHQFDAPETAHTGESIAKTRTETEWPRTQLTWIASRLPLPGAALIRVLAFLECPAKATLVKGSAKAGCIRRSQFVLPIQGFCKTLDVTGDATTAEGHALCATRGDCSPIEFRGCQQPIVSQPVRPFVWTSSLDLRSVRVNPATKINPPGYDSPIALTVTSPLQSAHRTRPLG
jgi:hypothetical protein